MFTSNIPQYDLTLKQPKALYLLFLVQMWECFSYYGMRTILVVFMLSELDYTDSRSFGVYAIYTSLVEAGGMVGGFLADRVFGLKFAIYLGAVIIAAGHICMGIPKSVGCFYLGLSLIIIGTSLFRTNCTAFLGEFYHLDDPRREAGFTIFYVGINIGALLAGILCAYVGEAYGWHYGFSLAAIGMCFGLIILFQYDYVLEDKGRKPKGTKTFPAACMCLLATPIIASMVYFYDIFIHLIPIIGATCISYVFFKMKSCRKQQKHNIITIMLAVLMLTLFFSCEEQIGSTLVLFSARNVDTNVLGYNIPAPSLNTLVAIGIIAFGPIVSKVLLHMEKKKNPPNPFTKMNLSILLMAAAFFILYIGCQFVNAEYLVKIDFVGLSFANLLSGYISQFMVVEVGGYGKISLSIYSQGFWQISCGCAVICIFITMIIFGFKKWYHFSD